MDAQAAARISQLDQVLKSPALSGYQNLARVRNDVAILLQNRATLQVQSGTFSSGSRSVTLCYLTGVLPITYKGATYNIPVTIYLDPGYPQCAPRCFVTPTSGMALQPNQEKVDSGGMVYHPYLTAWNGRSSSLVETVNVMSQIFTEKPPVYSVAAAAPKAAQAQPVAQAQPAPQKPWEAQPVMQQGQPTPAAQPAAAKAAPAGPFSGLKGFVNDMSFAVMGASHPQARWACPACEEWNKGARRFCNGCGREQGNAPVVHVQELLQREAEASATQVRWVCPGCDEYNKPHRAVCNGCQRARPDHVAKVDASPTAQAAPVPASMPVAVARPVSASVAKAVAPAAPSPAAPASSGPVLAEADISNREKLEKALGSRAAARWNAVVQPITDDMAAQLQKQAALEATSTTLQDEVNRLGDATKQSQNAIADLWEQEGVLREFIKEHGSSEEVKPAESLRTALTPNMEHVLDFVSEELALDEYLASLDELLAQKKVSLQDYMAETRDVSRRQFMCQANRKKAMGLLQPTPAPAKEEAPAPIAQPAPEPVQPATGIQAVPVAVAHATPVAAVAPQGAPVARRQLVPA
mmetsp:Transcript_46781/g.85626  ORF Transcript_46781/g.85626 Transcript_46781/m.85626 type:complete len:581 (+) Transcript_46781:69-1811(+)